MLLLFTGALNATVNASAVNVVASISANTNLLSNGDAENTLTSPWAVTQFSPLTNAGAALTNVTTSPHSGSRSFDLEIDGVHNNEGMWQTITGLQANTIYTFSVWTRTTVGNPYSGTAIIVAYDGTNTIEVDSAPFSLTTSYVQHFVTITTGVTGNVSLTLTVEANTGAGTILVDDAILVQQPVTATESVTPAAVNAVTTSGAPTITASATVTPSAVSAVTTIGAPTVSLSYNVSPGAVNATTAIGAMSFTAPGGPSPSAVNAVTTIGAPTIISGYASQVLADTPVAYYRLDETSGVMHDTSGNSRDATVGGTGATRGVTGLLEHDPDTAYTVAGAAFADAAHASAFDIATTGSLTVEFLVNASSFPSTGDAVSYFSTADEWAVRFTTAGLIQLRAWDTVGTAQLGLMSGTTFATGKTYHVVCVYNIGGTSRIYVNGVQDATGAFGGTFGNATAKLRIGGRGDGAEFFRGTIDEVAIYNYELSAARVAVHAQAAITHVNPAAVNAITTIGAPSITTDQTVSPAAVNAVTTIQGANNYIVNPGAESGVITPWSTSNTGSFGMVNNGATLTVTSSDSHSGADAFLLAMTTATNGMGMWQAITGLAPNTAYRYTAWFKAGTFNSAVVMEIKDNTNTVENDLPSFVPTASWVQHTLDITTGPTGNVTIVFDIESATNGTGNILVDDINLIQLPVTASATVSPAAVNAVTSIGAPTIPLPSTVNASAVNAVVTVPAPTITCGVTANVSAVNAVTSIQTPAQVMPIVVPSAVNATTAVNAPTITASASVSASVVNVVITVNAPTIMNLVGVAATAVMTAVSVFAPTITATANAPPGAVLVPISVNAPTVSGSVTVTPAAVAVAATVPTPAFTTSATVTLTTPSGGNWGLNVAASISHASSVATLEKGLWTAATTSDVPVVRIQPEWGAIQTIGTFPGTAGQYDTFDWSVIDPIIDAQAAAGAKILWLIGYTPTGLGGAGGTGKSYPNRDAANGYRDVANYAWSLVDHAENRVAGITAGVEVWNEPQGSFLLPVSNANYTAMLKTTYTAIKTGAILGRTTRTAYPNILVGTGGTSPEIPGTTTASDQWISDIISNGGGSSFDWVGVHPYGLQCPPDNIATWNQRLHVIPQLRIVLDGAGRTDAEIWLTEDGTFNRPDDTATNTGDTTNCGTLGSGADPLNQEVTESTAALRIQQLAKWWRDNRAIYKLGRLFYYELEDQNTNTNAGDWANHGGIYAKTTNHDGSGTQKPAIVSAFVFALSHNWAFATTSVPAPTITASATVTPSAVNATTAVNAPSITASATVTPAVVSCVITVPAPSLSQSVKPSAVNATTSIGAPTLTASANVTPAAVNVVATVGAPTLNTDQHFSVTDVDVPITVGAPTIHGDANVVAGPVNAFVTIPPPSLDQTVHASAVTVVVTIGAPALFTGVIAQPGSVNAVVTVGAPSVHTDQVVSASAVSVAIAVESPQVTAGVDAVVAAVLATTTVPAPTITRSATVTPNSVSVPITVGVPSVAGVAFVTPDAVAVAVTVPSPVVQTAGNATVNADAVAASVTIPAPQVNDSAMVTPNSVDAFVAVNNPSVSGTANASPAAVTVNISVPAPTVITTADATVTPSAVNITVAIANAAPQVGSTTVLANTVVAVVHIPFSAFVQPVLSPTIAVLVSNGQNHVVTTPAGSNVVELVSSGRNSAATQPSENAVTLPNDGHSTATVLTDGHNRFEITE